MPATTSGLAASAASTLAATISGLLSVSTGISSTVRPAMPPRALIASAASSAPL
jgi:hypothetical protein